MRDCLGMILFFSHQCNSTVTFVSAMMMILKNQDVRKNEDLDKSIYYRLATCCCELKKINLTNTDIGSGKYPRHQCSKNYLLSEDDVNNIFIYMIREFYVYSAKMKTTKSSDMLQKLSVFNDMKMCLVKRITGIGNLRAVTMISLASLTGFIPLDFYVNLPIHLSGGPGTFLTTEMNYNISNYKSLLNWNVSICQELKVHFSNEFTPNMFENASCIISRKKRKVDVFFHLPWYNKTKDRFTNKDSIQLCFRIVGHRTNNWELIAFTGNENHIILSDKNPCQNKFEIIHTSDRLSDVRCRVDNKWCIDLFTL